MHRWTGVLFAALLAAVPLLAADKDKDTDKKDDKGNDRAAQFKTIQADYRKAIPDVQKALKEAKTPKEREAALDKLSKEFAPRVLKLVEANPKDKESFPMLMWAVQALPNVGSKIFDQLAENWAKDEKIKALCQRLSFSPNPGAEKLLQKVLKENEDKDAKGFACFALAKTAAEKVDKGGKDATKEAAEAEKYYERCTKEFADVKFGRDTLGEQAKGSLFEIRHLAVGKTAPNVESKNLEGKKVELKDYKGKVVVLDIWATWCPPCRAMIPHEREMVKKLKDKPFALISISADAEQKTLDKFLESTEMPWTHWWNGQTGGILKDWNVHFFPTIYVLDSKGVIRHKNIRGKELEDAVEKLLAEAESKK